MSAGSRLKVARPRRPRRSSLIRSLRGPYLPAIPQWPPCFILPSRRGSRIASSAPTTAQADAWPLIKAGRDTLIAAPTGSGKTLAAFMAAIDDLVRQGLAGDLRDETQIVYVSPLKALSNDIQRNLEAPLAGIRDELRRRGLPDVDIRTWVRTGDTPPASAQRMRRRPPHIVVTTPESLYILLGSEFGPQDAGDHPDRDRRRDPRRRAQQARQPSRAVARAPRRPVRPSPAAHRPVGDAEADRRGRRASWSARGRRPTAPSSIPAIAARAISRSRCRTRRSKR